MISSALRKAFRTGVVRRLSGGDVRVSRYTLGAGSVQARVPPGWAPHFSMGSVKSEDIFEDLVVGEKRE